MSFNDYHYYASGRENCIYALFKIELKKRQCLFSTCTLEMIWPKKDLVHIEVPIRVPEYNTEAGPSTQIPLELLVCKKKEVKNYHQQFAYLKNFVGNVNHKSFKSGTSQESLVILAESDEAANHVID